MDSPLSSAPEPKGTPNTAPVVDPRSRPLPDYSTLEPTSDLTGASAGATHRTVRTIQFAPLLAIGVGISLALLVVSTGNARSPWSRFARMLHADVAAPAPVAAANAPQIDRMKPQKQAEALLEAAVAHSDSAVDQISSRVDHWQGQLAWDSQMATLTAAALNSNDMRVRESGIEVELAAYGLAKNSRSLEYVLKMVESPNHARKIWGLWALGLMGNRGVETARVLQVLSAHLKDSDEDSRHWAVEGLALVGGNDTIPLLLTAMHDDPSPVVREEAACGVAESGMFSHEQRVSAIPQLLSYTDDPALDARTHGWAFQALTEITGQSLPSDSAAWRNWYESRN